jgi:hypothetical protein
MCGDLVHSPELQESSIDAIQSLSPLVDIVIVSCPG